ncbi:MAG TPA: hypothetical protein VMW58_01465 [Anaerolineae bacterium]|nr:hypothetical protein [Anaerolineae bacterium]
MPRTKPQRRDIYRDTPDSVISAEDLLSQVPPKSAPKVIKTLTYEQRLDRQILMLNNAMSKYERVVNAGGTLCDADEKRLMQLVDGARKLELALAQIRAKMNGTGDMDDLEIALELYDKGKSFEEVVLIFRHNPNIEDQLQEALSARD